MVAPIDVLDTAVKIGLGALISGLAAYWVAKLNHDKTAEKERAQRRRDMLETIAEQVGTFNQVALKHWAFVFNWLKFTPPTEQMTDEVRIELTKLRSELIDSFKELINAEVKLLLIGEVKCQKLLREYGGHATIYRDEVVIKRNVTVQLLNKYKEDLDTKREAFFTELSNVYKNLE
ncbi:MAG TPA: hypothetical protein VJT09_16725 [Pyrinomonadaceae bacterium]|nr:hypothetical protein [Pyrinomonadaceae bacterium]